MATASKFDADLADVKAREFADELGKLEGQYPDAIAAVREL